MNYFMDLFPRKITLKILQIYKLRSRIRQKCCLLFLQLYFEYSRSWNNFPLIEPDLLLIQPIFVKTRLKHELGRGVSIS